MQFCVSQVWWHHIIVYLHEVIHTNGTLILLLLSSKFHPVPLGACYSCDDVTSSRIVVPVMTSHGSWRQVVSYDISAASPESAVLTASTSRGCDPVMTSHSSWWRVVSHEVSAGSIEAGFIDRGQRHVVMFCVVHSSDPQCCPFCLQSGQYIYPTSCCPWHTNTNNLYRDVIKVMTWWICA